MSFRPLILLLVGVLLTGCTSWETRGNLSAIARGQRFFVEERLNDNLGLHRLLVGELQARGFRAASGPLTMMPDDTQFIVTYDGREAWDFHSYLIELLVEVRPAQRYSEVVASAYLFRPGVTNKTPAEIVSLVANRLFPAHLATPVNPATSAVAQP